MGDTLCIVMGMNFRRNTPAASASDRPPTSVAADFPQHAADGGAAASYYAGNRSGGAANKSPGLTERQVQPANRSTEQYGPPTTNSPEGAGGPRNRWDREIAHWRAVGKPRLAADLQLARAQIAIAFEKLEPVWVPTDAQLVMFRLRAGAAANGLCTTQAA